MENEEQLLRQTVPLLLEWYEANRREMPWRESPTPYRVWISEVMLQQTRIEAVIPYFLRFLRELPDVESLAAVSDERLMKLWEGLGYYSRARNLKKTALLLTERYGGILPEQASELRKLPGIGDYTAGAISSIAYHRAEPAVDGNVLRVIMRLTACGDDIADPKTKKEVANGLRVVYPQGKDAAAFTQAWMEVGETLCLPNGAPKCTECPLCPSCRAYAAGTAENYPVKSPKKERRAERKTVLLLSCRGKYAVVQRKKEGLLAGLWEFPNFEGLSDEQTVRERLVQTGLSCREVRARGKSVHLFTHVEWEMSWFSAECDEEGGGFVWASPQEIAQTYAVPSAFRYYKKLMERKGRE